MMRSHSGVSVRAQLSGLAFWTDHSGRLAWRGSKVVEGDHLVRDDAGCHQETREVTVRNVLGP